MNPAELTNKPDREINEFLKETSGRLKHSRVLHAAGKLKNVRELAMLRKDIARAKTILALRQKQ
ncbi:MAG: 50S ribosomal protein L29 [Candidatus Terrybacteria bacterium RIFCSPLOWO2_01_FULL_44_24]|uniref:Large ribosomal subunit protein uL29 n=1 Tax=Candidatus Terrybacteria bacterium RIFCSPHIGHO2_01_FULL_43_35 TaxID=1802361 RepID=A0A1G2PD05_9BACT|nr:MAG: 50S ribosomal protein L29 [Candidatus Terrybacteria bacterium RIFCSPHIGHO2_01_FULL_43_35]OHA49426.1 MAG: 50S ribosomal protein L29 [Candidatus Terrybacteria bacterium RIFCSPHIGHO2_02_FULL_43_14]OHA51653.1 MAG: 50S ribosomal protein L29 [Candidatus Terrybacteria bacterium RIFCSPLOWO2_01_FULL_44_24]